jgi:uncharacterized protein YdcH (DUF465 family)
MSQDPNSKSNNTRSQQAAQSLNQLLDQCETQRSQLDAFLAGFEKKMAGKTIIGEPVKTMPQPVEQSPALATQEPVVSDKSHTQNQAQVSLSTESQIQAGLSPVNIQTPEIESWLKGSVSRLQTLDTSLSRREQRLTTLEGRLKDVVQTLTDKIQQAQANKQSLEQITATFDDQCKAAATQANAELAQIESNFQQLASDLTNQQQVITRSISSLLKQITTAVGPIEKGMAQQIDHLQQQASQIQQTIDQAFIDRKNDIHAQLERFPELIRKNVQKSVQDSVEQSRQLISEAAKPMQDLVNRAVENIASNLPCALPVTR